MEQSDSALPPAPGNADTAANVEGMTPAPPSTGFGQLWLKTLRMSLEQEATPESVMERWRERLPMLWPNGGEIYRSWRGIKTGEMAGIDLDLGPVTMSTGVVVDDVSPTSFTLQSPTGHLFAGRISFSTRTHDGKPLAEIEILMRANDPLYELGLKFGGHRKEEHFWAEMLWNLAGLYGSASTAAGDGGTSRTSATTPQFARSCAIFATASRRRFAAGRTNDGRAVRCRHHRLRTEWTCRCRDPRSRRQVRRRA